MPRMVVLLHETPAGYPRGTHFDLMFEHAGALRTWAAESIPKLNETLAAEQLSDHRLAYLDFEGALSGGRGTVQRVASGRFELLDEAPGKLVLEVKSDKLQGLLTLIRDQAAAQRWRISLTSG